MAFLSSFHCREVVLRLFPDAFVMPVSAAGQDVAEEIADDLAACLFQAARGHDGVCAGNKQMILPPTRPVTVCEQRCDQGRFAVRSDPDVVSMSTDYQPKGGLSFVISLMSAAWTCGLPQSGDLLAEHASKDYGSIPAYGGLGGGLGADRSRKVWLPT